MDGVESDRGWRDRKVQDCLMAPTTSHYAALQVARDCSADDLRRAYHRLARRHHPDKQQGGAAVSNGSVAAEKDDAEFHRVQHAYEVLRDPALRAAYDSQLKQDELLLQRDVEDVRIADTVAVAEMQRETVDDDDGDDVVFYSHGCRCGDVYEISEDELHDGVDVVPCNGCSLNIRVVLSHESEAADPGV